MTIRLALLVLALLSAGACNKPNHPQPVNPRASEEVRELLDFLYDTRGKQILTGQHNYSRTKITLTQSTDSVKAITGQTPVIWGSDFGGWHNRDTMIREAIRQHENGHIITLMWHADCPVDTMPNDVHPVRYMVSDKEWKAIVTPGTRFHKRLLEQYDQVAEDLKVLRDKGIPVLWRPYHEMNGIWFWWGNQPGKEGFAALWNLMYDHFTKKHRLDNLVWVWNANAPRDWEDDEAYDYHLFYPGDHVVDILAADVYKKDYKQSHHDDLQELAGEKLIALGEIGKAPDPESLDTQSNWSWFMMWANWPWKYNTPQAMQDLYGHRSVINFDEYRSIRD